jgi:5'-nucleotidase
MNILLTNDDGIDSEGIKILAKKLRSRGNRVFVIAPDSNRSGISHAISILSGPVKLTLLEEDSYSCSGFPGDCIIIGLKAGLLEKPCVVLSGINRGANLGTDIIYSGTAAAARQASLYNIPAIALSLVGNENYFWDMAASWAANHFEELLAHWCKGAFLNVNIPNCEEGPKGFALSWPLAKGYNDTLHSKTAPDGSRIFSMEGAEAESELETGSDCEIVSRNLVSVSTVYNYPVVYREFCPGSPDFAAVSLRGKKE